MAPVADIAAFELAQRLVIQVAHLTGVHARSVGRHGAVAVKNKDRLFTVGLCSVCHIAVLGQVRVAEAVNVAFRADVFDAGAKCAIIGQQTTAVPKSFAQSSTHMSGPIKYNV